MYFSFYVSALHWSLNYLKSKVDKQDPLANIDDSSRPQDADDRKTASQKKKSNGTSGPLVEFSLQNSSSSSSSSSKDKYVHPVYRYKEGNVLFNDALNTFYLRLYGVRHMVKDHSDSEKGNPLPPHRLLLSINSKGSFICTIPQTG